MVVKAATVIALTTSERHQNKGPAPVRGPFCFALESLYQPRILSIIVGTVFAMIKRSCVML
jgi:hypothetical protein